MKLFSAVAVIMLVSCGLCFTIGPGDQPVAPERPQEATRDLRFISETREWDFVPSFALSFAYELAAPGAGLYSYLQGCQGIGGGSCRRTLEPCAPVEIAKQTPSKTVIKAGGWKATTRDDLRGITYSDRMECEKAAGMEPTTAVGLVFDLQSLTILQVIYRSPADQAGLKPGQRLAKVDGQIVDTPQQALRLLRGAPGTEVDLTVGTGNNESVYRLVRRPWSDVFMRQPAAPATVE